jgi:5-methylcytosine-specific restriction protein A
LGPAAIVGLFLLELIPVAQPWAEWFYNSKAWHRCREAYKQSVNGLCERCLANGKYVVGEEVHHIIYLTPDNINDPYIALSWDNLELLCHECHTREHMSKYSATRDDVMFDEQGNLIPKYPPQ